MTAINETSNQPPTLEEQAEIAAYVTSLKERGFCKIDDGTANQTRLFNRFTGEKFYPAFLESDFDRYCRVNRKQLPYPGSGYLMRTLVHVVGHRFDPQGGPYSVDSRAGLTYVNLFRKYEPSSASTDVSPLFHEFWERMFPDPVQRHQALQWLAHAVQRPWERPSYHLLWTSDPGTGKGWVFENILSPILIHTEIAASYDKVLGRFSTMLETGLLVLLDDCKTSSSSTQTKLKSVLSEERQHVERKNMQGTMVRTYTRFILASNEARPLYLDEDERRWLAFDRMKHRVDATETQSFIAQLDAWIKLPGSLDAVYCWFLRYDLTGFNPKRPPESSALQAIVALSTNPQEEFAIGFAADNIVFTLAELQDALVMDGLTKLKPSHVPHIMSRLRYTKAQMLITGNRSTYYFPDGMSAYEVQEVRNGNARVVQGSEF
ncbi:primase-helicase family protein [Massilia phyllosphaerae]|uniref:primase-helicase family protein n=1 Tax=Massilia phyllosphaerae TaxID=3106034 RepID=UPI002B1CAF8A|nr:primase-helicase family protein [Massilia sp. SGZ-792]